MADNSPVNIISKLRQLSGEPGSFRAQMFRGGAGSALVQVSGKVLSLLLGVVLARGLGVEGYGIYAYTFALMTLLMVPAELGISTLLLRETAACQARHDWPGLRGVIVRGVQLSTLSALIIAAVSALLLWQENGGVSAVQGSTLLWMLLLLPVSVVIKNMVAALQGLQQVVKSQVVVMLIRPLLAIVGVVLLFLLLPDMRLPQYVMAIQFVVALAALVVMAAMLYRYLPDGVHSAHSQYHTRQWLKSSIPLTIIGGAGIINSQTDILMLGYFRTHAEVGIYQVAVQGAALVAFGLTAANAVIAPQFSRLYAQGDQARLQHLVTISARVILLAAMPVTLLLVFAGGWIAGVVFGAEFSHSHLPMAILAVAQLVNAAMGSVGFLLNMTGHEKDVARTLLFTAGLNVVLNYILIPLFGMGGAATATAISLSMWNILLFLLVKKRIGINSSALVFKINYHRDKA